LEVCPTWIVASESEIVTVLRTGVGTVGVESLLPPPLHAPRRIPSTTSLRED
jgi:hypothetical protein